MPRQALDSAVGLAVQPTVHDVLSLRRLLQPWSDTATVRDLDARLSAVASALWPAAADVLRRTPTLVVAGACLDRTVAAVVFAAPR